MKNCPVCNMANGFHDTEVHAAVKIQPKYLKTRYWHREEQREERPLVRDFRRAGHTKGLLDAVWYRLSDRALLERADLAESLEQMRRGEGREIDPAEFGNPFGYRR